MHILPAGRENTRGSIDEIAVECSDMQWSAADLEGDLQCWSEHSTEEPAACGVLQAQSCQG